MYRKSAIRVAHRTEYNMIARCGELCLILSLVAMVIIIVVANAFRQ